jgi:hypothetical protein
MIIKHGNNALSSVTAFPSAVPTGKPVLLSTATASSSASIEFTSGIDSTYDIYKFEYTDIHPSTDAANFQINFRDGGSNFDATKTTTVARAYHFEDDSQAVLGYSSGEDLAQSTSNQQILNSIGADNDQCTAGNVILFNPSSTTFVKHFIIENQGIQSVNVSKHSFIAGYCNVTAAIDGVKFQFSTGNIDAGTIKMYGISA